jgi:hypothetical protein
VFVEKVVCPYCNESVNANIEIKVCADDSKLVKKLLDKTLFQHKCKCGKKFLTNHCFTFLDRDKSLMLICTQDSRYTSDVEQNVIRDRLASPSPYKFARVMTTFKEFKEKYIIFTEGYDDRFIELLKLDVQERAKTECGDISEIVCMGINDRWISFRVVGSIHNKMEYVSLDDYRACYSKYAHLATDYKDVVINASWAIEHSI